MPTAILVGILMMFPLAMCAADAKPTPVLVELFTSEGCSSCPPADLFLQKLDGQPVSGAELIVLSEHVDYWDHDGWKDPYSSTQVTNRQTEYGQRLDLDSVYTPQILVDGVRQASGNDIGAVGKAIQDSLQDGKVPIRVSGNVVDGKHLHINVQADELDKQVKSKSAEIFLVLALNHAESQVRRGENANRHLTHTAVVKKLVKLGKVEAGKNFSRDVDLGLDSGADPANLRIIAFLQDRGSGRIVGAAMKKVDAPAGGVAASKF